MNSFLRKIGSITSSERGAPWTFLAVAVLAYGLLIWQFGFYWDDLPMSWIRYELGPEAMARYFSTSRPVWGMVFQITTRLIPQVPLYWQIFALLLRWATCMLFYAVIRELLPGRRHLALTASLFFLLYPGFNFQWVSYLSSHFFIVICIFLLSYLLMLKAFGQPERFRLFTAAALILSALNLWMMEYFFFLEILRPLVIFLALSQVMQGDRILQIARRSLLHWTPYLLVFLANVFYRSLVFTNVAYDNVLLADLRADPLGAGIALAKEIKADLLLVGVDAWRQVFQFPSSAVDGPRTTLFYFAIVAAVGVVALLFLLHFRAEKWNHRPALWTIALGLVAMLLGGGPYWLANLEISLAFPASRFTISFMLGVSLLLAGLLELIPARIRFVLAAVLVALASGRHVISADAFRRDWITQKNLFWQLNWRAPGIEPNTLVLMNEVPLEFYADNSLSAGLNWIYAPKGDRYSVDYVLFYPTTRLRYSLPRLEPGIPIWFDYIAAEFNGNTSQTLSIYFAPPGCLRVLDPEIERVNRLIPEPSLMRFAARLSDPGLIVAERSGRMPDIYRPEPVHGWCYYFQKADLARQFDDWEEVAKLGDQAFGLDDYPNDPVERFVFIEGYAHVGKWDRALELSDVSYRVSREYVGPPLCRLWKRIETETSGGLESDASGESKRSDALSEVKRMFACNP